jgi:hypothetical protein
VRGRRQTDDKQPCLWIAKARHRLAPIVPLAVALYFLMGDTLTMSDKAGAEGARNDLALEG